MTRNSEHHPALLLNASSVTVYFIHMIKKIFPYELYNFSIYSRIRERQVQTDSSVHQSTFSQNWRHFLEEYYYCEELPRNYTFWYIFRNWRRLVRNAKVIKVSTFLKIEEIEDIFWKIITFVKNSLRIIHFGIYLGIREDWLEMPR